MTINMSSSGNKAFTKGRALTGGRFMILAVSVAAVLTACDSGSGNSGFEFEPCEGPAPSATNAGYISGQVAAAEDEKPVEGAAIRLDGVEGCVSTDETGKFTFPLAGGGRFSLLATAQDRTHARRVSTVTVGHDMSLGTIYVPLMDKAVTTIGPEGGVHKSANGGLQLAFPKGALAESTKVRATRFNQGRALPGPLPSTSHFTMALEAMAGDGTLGEPVVITIPNEYGFPPGTAVPVGVFNETTGQWEPDGMGVISEDGTQVVYEAKHFSAFDCNYPVNSKGEPGLNGKDPRRKKDPCKRNGSSGNSIVDIRSGQLRLDFDLTLGRMNGQNRNVGLVYQSGAATPGVWTGGPWSDTATDPKTPEYGGIEVQVEGIYEKVFVKSSADGNWAAYIWDGKNGRGEMLPTGLYDGWIRVFNAEKGTFAQADVFGGQPTYSLGIEANELVEADTTIFNRFQLINGQDSPVADGWYIKGIPELYKHADGSIMVVLDGESGGVYEPASRATIHAGGGDGFECSAGSPKENPCIQYPKDLAVAPDGSLITTDDFTNALIKITTTGTVEPIYSGETEGYGFQSVAVSPDGIVYFSDEFSGKVFKLVNDQAEFVIGGDYPDIFNNTPTVSNAKDIDFDADGNLFIADWPLGLRKLSTDGVLTNAYTGPNPDYPAPDAIDVTDDGSILLAETNRQRVRRLMPDGRILPVAGMDGVEGFSGDGGEAVKAKLYWPNGVVQGSDGTVYISDSINDRIRSVDTNGTIRTFAGKGSMSGSGLGDGGPATEAMIDDPRAPVMDADGNVLVLGHSQGHMWRFDTSVVVYSRPKSQNDVINFDVASSTYSMTNENGQFVFSADGRLKSITTTNGETTTVTRDQSGRITTLDGPGDFAATFQWGTDGLESISGPNGRAMQVEVDAARTVSSITFPDSRQTSLSYDDKGRLTGWTDADNRTTEYTLDGYGRVKAVKSADDAVRTYVPLESQGLVNDLIDADAGVSATAPADAITMPITSFTDANGLTTTYKYDALGEASEMVLPDGSVFTIQNDACGMPSMIIGPEGLLKTAFYDEWGRTLVDKKPAGDTEYDYDWENGGVLKRIGTAGGRSVGFEYDEKGRVTAITLDDTTNMFTYGYRDDDQISWVENGAGQRSDYTYDDHGNLSKLTQSSIDVALFDRDENGNVVGITDALGKKTSFTLDNLDRVSAITDPEGNQHVIGRDSQGQVTSLTSSGTNTTDGLSTMWGRDEKGRVASVSILGAEPWQLTIDGEDQVTAITSQQGSVTVVYNSRGQVISRTVASASGGEPEVAEYTYDQAGHMVTAIDNDSRIEWEYASDTGILTAITQIHDGMTDPIRMLYDVDADGFVNAIEYPPMTGFAGGRYEYDYDGISGKLTEITDPDSQYFDLYRDAAGRITEFEVNWGEDLEIIRQMDGTGRLEKITAYKDNWQEDTHIEFSYTFDMDGSFLSENGPADQYVWTYDDRHRVTSGVNNYAGIDESFQYNARGEVISAGYEYDEARRLTQGAGYTYAYDSAGRVTSRIKDADNSRIDLFWDGDDNLVKAEVFAAGSSEPDNVIAYGYDAIGRRIYRDVDGVRTFFIYDFTDVVLEVNAAGDALAFYMHDPATDTPLIMVQDGESYAIVIDGLGSVRGLVRLSDKTLVSTWNYSTFGKVVNSTGTIDFRYGFQGREPDPLTGLIHFRAREYDPIIGRYMSTDPMKFTSFGNTYNFPGNDPVNRRDPDGMGPRIVKVTGEAIVTYNDAKQWTENKIEERATAVGGREMGQVGVLVWKTVGANMADQAIRVLPTPYQSMGPTLIEGAGWLYKAYKAEDPCARAKVGTDMMTDIFPAGKKWFKPMADSFNSFGSQMDAAQ
jgi:RHS repeat-associated protein